MKQHLVVQKNIRKKSKNVVDFKIPVCYYNKANRKNAGNCDL